MPKQLPIAVDIAGADPLHLNDTLKPLVEAGAECYCALSDGRFTPQLRGDLGVAKALRSALKAKMCVHLLAEEPERHIESAITAGATAVAIPLEATSRAYPVLRQLREAGVSPGVALNPATALTKLEYLLPLVDRVLLLGRDPGDPNPGLLPVVFDRVRILTEFVQQMKRPMRVEVLGCDSLDDAAKLVRFGATGLILRDLVFKHENPAAALHALRQDILARVKIV